jgi:prevent-host-death family protein
MPIDGGSWQASEAQSNFSEVMKRALSGSPQTIREGTGEEVVVIAKTDYEALLPTLKDYLLHGGSSTALHLTAFTW